MDSVIQQEFNNSDAREHFEAGKVVGTIRDNKYYGWTNRKIDLSLKTLFIAQSILVRSNDFRFSYQREIDILKSLLPTEYHTSVH